MKHLGLCLESTDVLCHGLPLPLETVNNDGADSYGDFGSESGCCTLLASTCLEDAMESMVRIRSSKELE